MNRQELFSAAYKGLAAQGWERATVTKMRYGVLDSVCQYRATAPDGTMRKCAIGHAIPDDLYTPEMDSDQSLIHVLEAIGYEQTGIGSDNYQFALTLRTAHDCASSPDDMQRQFNYIADSNALNIPAIN